MDITHPGQQSIFFFCVFVEFVLHLFHGVCHVLELNLFHNFICLICPYLVRILFIYVLTNIILVLFISFYVCVYLWMHTYLRMVYFFMYVYWY